MDMHLVLLSRVKLCQLCMDDISSISERECVGFNVPLDI